MSQQMHCEFATSCKPSGNKDLSRPFALELLCGTINITMKHTFRSISVKSPNWRFSIISCFTFSLKKRLKNTMLFTKISNIF